MSARKETIRFLKRQIEGKMVQTESHHSFFPEVYLNAVFTLDDVTKAVDELECPVVEKAGLAHTIREKGTRVFAILIKNGEEDLITEFRKHDVLDVQLPVGKALAKHIAGDFGVSFARDHQRQFLPYRFPRDMRDYHRFINHDERILPFVGEPKVVASGGFGDISKVTIFESQQDFILDKNGPVQVIRKQIRFTKEHTKESYDNMYFNEHRCLVFLDRLAHPNIIRLLGSYTYNERHYFLFPGYQTDLSAFLKSKSRFEDFAWDPTFFSALRGLASALCSTHKLHLEKGRHGLDVDAIGYHHDLRPSNVLINHETFVLADFGLSKFKSAEALSQTEWKLGAGDYSAPECMEDDFARRDVGRAFDVWAFGCLMIEVIIYMKKGAASLEEFREQRNSSGRNEQWEDSYFYGKDGNVKTVVLRWLDSLTPNLLRKGPVSALVRLSKKALKRDPVGRPKIEDICADLTQISLKAHFVTVRDLVHDYMNHYGARRLEATSHGMESWLESERLAAFGHITGLDSDSIISSSSIDLAARYIEYEKAFKRMMVQYHKVEFQNPVAVPHTARGSGDIAYDSARSFERFENDLRELIETLWSLLPVGERRRAEAAWLRAMLDTEDVRRLDNVGRAFRVEKDSTYKKGAALAMMKRIGLNMGSSQSIMPEGFMVSENDVRRQFREVQHHEFGLFRGSCVLIEWMYYSSGWEKVRPDQRAITMGYKVQGFSEETKPAGMRTLNCIGACENTGDKAGYGFLYAIPIQDPEMEISSSTVTLLQLMQNKKCQPLLCDKLRLACTLAQFLGDFHQVGWLHEEFISNNVIFFNVKSSEQNSSPVLAPQTLKQPYVVGLQKSRFGGMSWDTTGPFNPTSAANSVNFQDYQHPEYASTQRYRATYDYYNLGLILLELGFWQPLRVWATSKRCLRMDLTDFRQELIKTYVPLLGVVTGAVYRDVVHFCLSGSMDGPEDLDKHVLEEFANNVVEPLKDLAELYI